MRLHLRFSYALGALILLSSSLNSAWAQERNPAATRLASRRTNIVAAVERVKGAVVNIHSERSVPGTDIYGLTSSQSRVNGMGTGIIIDPRGYIVTNHHVVEDVNLLRVRLADGTTQNAFVVARDPEKDLALLKIDAVSPLPTMPLGTATDLMVGETVIAIGNAYGYEHTVSVGIVSAAQARRDAQQGHVVQVADPDRRQHQSRQLGRPAGQHQRRAGRRQRRHPGGRPGHRLRHSGRSHGALGDGDAQGPAARQDG